MSTIARRVAAARWRSARNAFAKVLPDLWAQATTDQREEIIRVLSKFAGRPVRAREYDLVAALDQILDRLVLSETP